MRIAFDENVDNDIIRGVMRQRPEMDAVRVQDAGLRTADDVTILEWAATENRVLFTQDADTMIAFAYHRVQADLLMPRLFEINDQIPIGQIINDILDIVDYSLENEWEGQVRYLPLK